VGKGCSPSPGRADGYPVDVLLVCSAGGHLMQLHMLRAAWEESGLRVAWVTLDREDARSLLAREDVMFAYGPTTRHLGNLARNILLAWKIVRGRRPRAIVTTGAAVAVPFVWIGRLLRVPTVYIESLTRIERPSLSCRLVRPVASRVYGQWPEVAAATPRMRYAGQVIDAA
jgi:beta-1,4-N-acetylglucosaminyltransferase